MVYKSCVPPQVPYSVLDRPTNQRLWPVFRNLYEHTSDLQLTSGYGLFRRMTGVGGRPEVILEGANSLDGPWVEYEFPYKPGRLDRMPPFVSKLLGLHTQRSLLIVYKV